MTEPNPKDLVGLTKAPLRLVPPAAVIRMAAVLGHGAAKYGPYNWRDHPVRRSVYLEAAMRHIAAALDGEDADSESGEMHEAHVAACMAVVLDAEALGKLIDDRPTPGAAPRLLAEAAGTDVPKATACQMCDVLGRPAGRTRKRTARAIRQDIDAHLGRCAMCHRWFMTDDDLLDAPCSTMRDLHDEYDGKVRGGRSK